MGLYPHGETKSERFHIPGLGLGKRVLKQWRGYLLGRWHQARGRLVIFDRYCYDALLPPRQPATRLSKLRRWLLGHSCPPPDMVIMLDAPGETLYSRIGEHDVGFLEARRQDYLQLSSRIPRSVVVDASRSEETVRREVTSLIWNALSSRPKVGAR